MTKGNLILTGQSLPNTLSVWPLEIPTLSVSRDLVILDILNEWNHAVCDLLWTADGHLGCLHLLVVGNSVIVNPPIQVTKTSIISSFEYVYTLEWNFRIIQ